MLEWLFVVLIFQFLLKQWLPIPTCALWSVDVGSSNTLWWAFVLIHALCWTIIYGGSVIMDLPELLGIKQVCSCQIKKYIVQILYKFLFPNVWFLFVKQVYYDINKLLPPMVYKSRDLVRLYSHVRHPSFFGLSIILWATNIMRFVWILNSFCLCVSNMS